MMRGGHNRRVLIERGRQQKNNQSHSPRIDISVGEKDEAVLFEQEPIEVTNEEELSQTK